MGLAVKILVDTKGEAKTRAALAFHMLGRHVSGPARIRPAGDKTHYIISIPVTEDDDADVFECAERVLFRPFTSLDNDSHYDALYTRHN